jgi:hypothetical protein
MKLLCSWWPATWVTLSLAYLFFCPRPLSGQTFFELAGGWNNLAPAPQLKRYTHGFNARASIGRQLTPRFQLRFDAFTSQFDETTTVYFYPPCAFGVVCHAMPSYFGQSMGIAALTANGLVDVDSRGMFYLIGGVGFYDTYGALPTLSTGASVGAGISIPIRARLRVFAEARDHFLFGANSQPPWLVPITLGLRY